MAKDEYRTLTSDIASALVDDRTEANRVANKAYNASIKALRADAANANAQADILYAQAENALNDQFRNASDTTINKLRVNYGQGVDTINQSALAGQQSALAARNQQVANNSVNYYDALGNTQYTLGKTGINANRANWENDRAFNYNKRQNEQALAWEKKTYNDSRADRLRQAKKDEVQTRKAEKERAKKLNESYREAMLDQYVSTIGRFDSDRKIDSEIARLQKSKDPNAAYKIWALQAQKANLAAAQEAEAARAARAYSSRWGGGSGDSYGIEELDLSDANTPSGIRAAGESAMSPYLEYGTQRGIRTMGDAAVSPYLNSRQAQGQAFVNVAASSNSKVDTSKVATYVMTHPTATAEDIMNSNLNDREALMAIAALGIDGTEPKLDTTRAKEAAKASEANKTKKTKSKKTNSYEATSAYKYAAQAAGNIVNNLSRKR